MNQVTTSTTTSTPPKVIFQPSLLTSSSSESLLSYAFRTSATTKPLISIYSETPHISVSFPTVSEAIISGSSPLISNLTPTSDFNIFTAITSSNKPNPDNTNPIDSSDHDSPFYVNTTLLQSSQPSSPVPKISLSENTTFDE